MGDAPPTTPILSDGTVLLRAFTKDDTEAHLKGEDAEQARWLNNGKRSTKKSVIAWIENNQKELANGGKIACFAIEVDGTLVGFVEANMDAANMAGCKPGDANLSYGLYPQFRGEGYTTRAITLLEKYLFKRRVSRSVIRVNPENLASLAVPRRLYYWETGTIQTAEETLKIFVKRLLPEG